MPGWPVDLTQPVLSTGKRPAIGNWMSSASVAPGPDGKQRIIIAGPGNGATIFSADGRLVARSRGVDDACSVPVADLDGDGVLDLIADRFAATIDGKPLPGRAQRRAGYAPCIGDADGDGKLDLYRLFFTTRGTSYADVVGFDHTGKPLPGWPRMIDDPSWCSPVMGDITGDSKMEIIGTHGQHLFAWTWDGKPLPNTSSEGPLDGILATDISAASSAPALADLDGDGKAEIILFDQQRNAVRAWHGDGRGFGRDDGVIAELPCRCAGVSVGDLGGDGVMDFFTGVYWVRRAKDGSTTVTAMLPEPMDIHSMQPTITDIDGDGKADILFAVPDGRVIVYQTGLAYKPQWMQWPTNGGNIRHTGAWTPPAASNSRRGF